MSTLLSLLLPLISSTVMDKEDCHNHDIFRDCLFAVIVEKLAPTAQARPQRASKKKPSPARAASPSPNSKLSQRDESSNPADLAEFADYLSSEGFHALPAEFRSLSHQAALTDPTLSETYSLPLSPTTMEKLIAYLP